jgi:hypothetical protein
MNSLVAVDAYNGTLLWEYALPGILAPYHGDHLMGVSGTGSNFCLSDDSVYVRRNNQCLRLDARTGRLLGTFTCPETTDGAPSVWGFIAHENGLLFGSLANPEHVVTYRYRPGGDMTKQLTESKTLFALDAHSGELKWRYDAKHSLRHNGVAVGAGYVVLIDRPLALYDRTRDAKPTNDPNGELVALYAGSGEVLWRNDQNIFGTVTSLSADHHRVLMSYQPTRFRLASEIGGRLACFDLASGERLWEKAADYSSRTILNDRTIYAEGGAWDLLTGDPRPFPFERSYGCGTLAGSKNLLLFRSATLGYYDLNQDYGTEEFGGMRPGCWINALPAGGLVFVPEASSGCVCSYQNQAWIALQPDGVRPPEIVPPGRLSRQPIAVQLKVNHPDSEQVRYTLDGSKPTAQSPLFRPPLTLTRTVELQARSFGPNNRASRVATARFTIDPNALTLDENSWRAWSARRARPRSRWTISESTIIQSANTLRNVGNAMGKDPAAERPGTLFIYQEGSRFQNGRFHFQMQSQDNDTVGVAFRLQDPEHYYLWSLDSERGFRALTMKNGTNYTLLASNQKGYEPNKWYNIQIDLEGPRLSISVDGQEDFQAEDARFANGTIALYTWGNTGVTFRELRFEEAEE